jgi:HSP20 family molecular chaperone IbpA
MNTQNPQNDRSPTPASLKAMPVYRRRVLVSHWLPAVDVTESGEEYLFQFDLPGLKKEEFQVRVDGTTLSLTGVRTTWRCGEKRLRVERLSGAFVRRLVLPKDSRIERIHATLCNGVLQLHVPKYLPPDEDRRHTGSVRSDEPKCEHTGKLHENENRETTFVPCRGEANEAGTL